MADKSISELAVAQQMTDDALTVVYQNGETRAIEGQLIKKYARESTEPYVEGAVQSAKEAAESSKQAGVSAATAKENADKTAADVVVVQGAADAERERVVAEEERQTAETGRVEAEQERVEAEAARNVWEAYNPNKDYVPGNKMTYGGSSYLCVHPMNGSTDIQALLNGMTAYAKDNSDTAYFDSLTLDNLNLDFRFYRILRGVARPYTSLSAPVIRLKELAKIAHAAGGDYVDEAGNLKLDWRQAQYYLLRFRAYDPSIALLPADSYELTTSSIIWRLIAAKGADGVTPDVSALYVWEDYDAEKEYIPGNKVVYRESSWLCVRPAKGEPPGDWADNETLKLTLAASTDYWDNVSTLDPLLSDELVSKLGFRQADGTTAIETAAELKTWLMAAVDEASYVNSNWMQDSSTLYNELTWNELQYYILHKSEPIQVDRFMEDSSVKAVGEITWLPLVSWRLIAARGTDGGVGPTGPQGPQGPQGPAGTGSGDMLATVYDPAGKAAQVATEKELTDGLAGKADLDPVTRKVKPEQLPPIKTDQVVEQAEAPTSPDTILWVDTDEETPGVDIEGIRAEAELAHTTADSAITMINAIEESITQIENKNDAQDTTIAAIQAKNAEQDVSISVAHNYIQGANTVIKLTPSTTVGDVDINGCFYKNDCLYITVRITQTAVVEDGDLFSIDTSSLPGGLTAVYGIYGVAVNVDANSLTHCEALYMTYTPTEATFGVGGRLEGNTTTFCNFVVPLKRG